MVEGGRVSYFLTKKLVLGPKRPIGGLKFKEILNKYCKAFTKVHLFPIRSHLVMPRCHYLRYGRSTKQKNVS